MKIYIASSWRNANGVELLTAELRNRGHQVISWVENNYGENHNHVTKAMDFETWVKSEESDQSFIFDTDGAINCDLLIYYGPAGMDACAELGAAYASQVARGLPYTAGLWAKTEGIGLMRKMVSEWFDRPASLLNNIEAIEDIVNYEKAKAHAAEASGRATEGIKAVVQERMEQINKHGHNPYNDHHSNNNNELVSAVFGLLNHKYGEMPEKWNQVIVDKMMAKSDRDRKVMAAALLIAEIDRMDYASFVSDMPF